MNDTEKEIELGIEAAGFSAASSISASLPISFVIFFSDVKKGGLGISPTSSKGDIGRFERSEKRTMYIFALLANSRTRHT